MDDNQQLTPEQQKALDESGGIVRGSTYVLLSLEAYRKLMGLTSVEQQDNSLSALTKSLRSGHAIPIHQISRNARPKPKKKSAGAKKQLWIEARKRFHLSHAHVQMARELGLDPKKLGGMANSNGQKWKIPMPDYIEEMYLKRFRKRRPDTVVPVEKIGRKRKQNGRNAENENRTKQEVDSSNKTQVNLDDVPF